MHSWWLRKEQQGMHAWEPHPRQLAELLNKLKLICAEAAIADFCKNLVLSRNALQAVTESGIWPSMGFLRPWCAPHTLTSGPKGLIAAGAGLSSSASDCGAALLRVANSS